MDQSQSQLTTPEGNPGEEGDNEESTTPVVNSGEEEVAMNFKKDDDLPSKKTMELGIPQSQQELKKQRSNIRVVVESRLPPEVVVAPETVPSPRPKFNVKRAMKVVHRQCKSVFDTASNSTDAKGQVCRAAIR